MLEELVKKPEIFCPPGEAVASNGSRIVEVAIAVMKDAKSSGFCPRVERQKLAAACSR